MIKKILSECAKISLLFALISWYNISEVDYFEQNIYKYRNN